MAEITQLTGDMTLREMYPKVNANVTKVNAEITSHKASDAAHGADAITYSGDVSGAANVKQAVDKLKQRVDTIVSQAGDDNTEIVDARGDAPVLGDRLNGLDAQLADIAIIPKLQDGESNWTDAIHRAIAEAKSSGRNRVYFYSGVYEHDGILIEECDYLIFEGHKDAILKLSEESTAHVIQVRNSKYVKISGLTIEGNLQLNDEDLLNSRGISLSTGAKGCTIDNVLVKGTKGDGILLGDVNQASNVQVRGSGGYGIVVGADCNLSNCQAGVTYREGFNFQGGNTNASSIYAWMSGNNEDYQLAQNVDCDGIRIAGKNVVLAGFNVLASNRHGVFLSSTFGANITGTVDRCGRNSYYNNGSCGVYVNNAKSSIVNVSVQNNDYDSVDDEGLTKTAVHVQNPNLSSTNNTINVTSSNVDNLITTSDTANLENSNLLTPLLLTERNKQKNRFIGTYSDSISNSTSIYPQFSASASVGFEQKEDNHIYVGESGLYSIHVDASLSAGTGLKILAIQRNSSNIDSYSGETSNAESFKFDRIMRLNANDRIRFRFFQSTGAALDGTCNIEIYYLHS